MNTKTLGLLVAVVLLVGGAGAFIYAKQAPAAMSENASSNSANDTGLATTTADIPQEATITGTWECLPHKDTSGPHTLECAFGIKGDNGKHYAVSTSLMSQYSVDFPTGARVRVQGVLVPVEQLSSIQKYDIAGIINATSITKVSAASDGKLMSIDSYVTQNISTLSPVKATLGGTFYVTGLEAHGGSGTVHYEDGHNAYIADFTYTVSDTATGAGNIQVTSFIVR
jgi:hypothetical protein